MGKIIPLIQITENPPLPFKRSDRKIKVGFVQLNNSFSGQTYFPLSVGLLQAYAQKFTVFPDCYEFLPSIFQFMKIGEVAEMLSEADIVGYSSYGWNEQNSLAIAGEVKRRNPNVVNIFGGPQVPDSHKQFQRIKKSDPKPEDLKYGRIGWTEAFHRQNPYVDMACHGEGERVFTAVLNQMATDNCQNKDRLPSISYIDSNDVFHHNPKLERMNDEELAKTSSPYLNGIFNLLMEKYPKQIWIGMWETNRGCPYQCTYCDWGGAIEDRVSKFPMESRLHKEALWFGKNKITTIFCPDANFGIFPRDVEISEYLAEAKRIYGYPNGVSVQNAKNPKEHTIKALMVLEKAGLNRATVMSQQSMNPATLKAVRRENMKLDEYFAMQKIAAKEGVYTMTDIIFPMPEETYDSIADGIETLISNGQHNRIQFGIISLWPNTEMNDPEYQEMYGIESVKTKIINIHGKKMTSVSGVEEWQTLAITTSAMPRQDWVRTRVLTWMTDTIYFNKLLQIPAIILNRYGISYRQFIELFMNNFGKFGNYPVLTEIYSFLTNMAKALQEGRQEEFIHSKEWLDIYWPPGEYILIKLCVEGKLRAFYEETEMALSSLLKDKAINIPDTLLHESISLNQALIKIPFQTKDIDIKLSHNIWDVYRATLLGKKIELLSGNYTHTIDRTTEKWEAWDKWFQEVVWYGNRRGAYLYGNKNPHQEIAGHH